MKIKDLIAETLKKNETSWVSISTFLEEFKCYAYPSVDEHEDLKCYVIHTWMCTDTLVGYLLYTYKGEPCCITSQTGRKNDISFFWISEEMYFQVMKFCFQFISSERRPVISTFDVESPADTIVDEYYVRRTSKG